MMHDGAPSFRYVLQRLRHLVAPPVTITPPPDGIVCEYNVAVPVRDGTVLRVNVFRPAQGERFPIIMCAHPYGKDNAPQKPGKKGYKMPFQYRIMHQSQPFSHSAMATWEAPDPGFWVPRGYAMVNCDLRGFGKSDGVGSLMTAAEGDDYHDLIEWAAAQSWSNGKIGLCGVSYLALSQWRVAATRPPHLAAICPWEGFADLYRDFARPGGIRENGFFMLWNKAVRRGGRTHDDLYGEQGARPTLDEWWEARTPDLSLIDVPALVCGSFSDHTLHSGGSFRGFAGISSRHRWLYTHRGGKWSTFYSPEALAFQARFFDWALKGEENGMTDVPPVRLEVRTTRDEIHAVRQEASWPLPATRPTPLWLHADGSLSETAAASSASATFDMHGGRLSFSWTVPHDVEVSGPMKLRLHVETRGASDVSLFVGVRKFRGDEEVVFEGPYGFGLDMVTRGWLKASMREIDETRSTPWLPFHTFRNAQPLREGEIVAVEIPLMPSATFFARGETLRLDVQGHWFYIWNPLLGEFPASYEPSGPGICVVYAGGEHDAHLLIPVIPSAQSH